jgi:hypothetical protein
MRRLFREDPDRGPSSSPQPVRVYGLTDRRITSSALRLFPRFHQVDDAVLGNPPRRPGRRDVRHLSAWPPASTRWSSAGADPQTDRDAHKLASRPERLLPNSLFMSAIECGRKVRNETALGLRRRPFGIALLVGRIFEELAGGGLVIGAGETAELTARLRREQRHRHPRHEPLAEKAAALAASVGGQRSVRARRRPPTRTRPPARQPVVGAKALAWARQKAKRRGPLRFSTRGRATWRSASTAVRRLPLRRRRAERLPPRTPKARRAVQRPWSKKRGKFATISGLMRIDVLKGAPRASSRSAGRSWRATTGSRPRPGPRGRRPAPRLGRREDPPSRRSA